jgi:hypothetical protein
MIDLPCCQPATQGKPALSKANSGQGAAYQEKRHIIVIGWVRRLLDRRSVN